VRDQIVRADVILGDVSGANPNVLYEIGFAHAYNKPVIFLTQDDPKDVPVDIRQFEFIRYDLSDHVGFLSKLDNAVVSNLDVEKYRVLHHEAKAQLNSDMETNYEACGFEEFRARAVPGGPDRGYSQ
jgi:nucleoside 2-deoxyribosyltransferase